MQDRQQRTLIYNQCTPPHPDPSSHSTARPSITFPHRAARIPKPPCTAQPESRTQNLLAPRNQNPEPKTSSRRTTRTQNVPDSSRSGLVVTAVACRYRLPGTWPVGILRCRRSLPGSGRTSYRALSPASRCSLFPGGLLPWPTRSCLALEIPSCRPGCRPGV